MKSMFRLLALVSAAISMAANAQTSTECYQTYSPKSGQAGKDVIWVPTPDVLVKAMLKSAQVTNSDLVYDLGAGDGKIAIEAAKSFGARAVGIEYNADMARLAQCLVRASGVANKVEIVQGDIFEADFSKATVVTLYLLPELNERLMPTLLKMKPGTRIVSHSFLIGDWRPDERIIEEGYDRAYKWIVPAQVQGTWSLQLATGKPLTVRLEQQYQTVWGVVVDNGVERKIDNASLSGNQLELTYSGADGVITLKGAVTASEWKGAVSNGSRSSEFQGKRN